MDDTLHVHQVYCEKDLCHYSPDLFLSIPLFALEMLEKRPVRGILHHKMDGLLSFQPAP